MDLDGEERIQAGIRFALMQSGTQGHTCVPDEWLVKSAASLLSVDPVDVRTIFQHLIDENRLRTEEVGGETCVYAEYLYQAEVGVAKRLMVLRDRVNQLWQVDYQKIIEAWEKMRT